MSTIPVRTITFKGMLISEFRDGALSLVYPEGQGAIHTIGDDNGKDLVQTQPNQTTTQVRPDAWKVIEVLPRARYMYDHSQFHPDAPHRPRQARNLHGILTVWPHGHVTTDNHWNDGGDEARHEVDPTFTIRSQPEIRGAYVGYSLYMTGPVLVRGLRSNSTTEEARLNTTRFNFQGNDFRVEPSTKTAGSRTIPHFAFTMPANLKAIKRWAAMESIGGPFTTIYNGSSQTLSIIRRSTQRSAQALLHGQAVKPVIKNEALSTQAFNVAIANPNSLVNPNEAEGPLNPKYSELLCDGSLLRRGHAEVSGFRYGVPYIKVFQFPPELTSMLYEFTRRFPQDLFTLDLLYLALYAWYDTVSTPLYNTEKAIPGGPRVASTWTVPEASLSECLVYYTHWLRWTEEMGLAEYPHPFRFIRKAVNSDRSQLSLVVNNSLDESRIKDLMLGIRSKSRHINVNDRLLMLPHMMRDSHMPRMVNIEPYRFPTYEELLLTGLPSVKHCGTPTYERLTSESFETIRLCVPAALADNSFHGTAESLRADQSTITSLVKGLDGHPQIVTSKKVECGRFWSLDLGPIANGSYVPGSLGPPPEMIDPFLDLRGALSSSMQSYTLFQQRHWLGYAIDLETIKLGKGQGLHINERGFITPIGIDVLPAERLLTQPAEMFFGPGGREVFLQLQQQTAIEDVTFQAAPIPQGPSPIADEIIATISNAPTMRYVVWNRVLNTLQTAPPEGRTPASLVELLQSAVRQEDEIWAWIEDFDEQLSMETLMQVDQVSLAWRIRDLMGMEALHQDARQTINVTMPHMYATSVYPLFLNLRYTRSADGSEDRRTHFNFFVANWRQLKRLLKSNKLAPSMRDYLNRLEGSPLPPKREDISSSHGAHPGESFTIDLTME